MRRRRTGQGRDEGVARRRRPPASEAREERAHVREVERHGDVEKPLHLRVKAAALVFVRVLLWNAWSAAIVAFGESD